MDANIVTSFFFGSGEDESQKQLNEQLAPLVERCHEDEAFKESFMADPRQVIANETDIDVDAIPENYTFYVVDKSDPRGIYVHIPINEDSLELSEEELELVAGGEDINGLCIKNLLFCGKKKKNDELSE